jgi:hypothetical protein
MPRFHFHLRASSTILRDRDGSECADLPAAHSHAVGVATELMRNSGRNARLWSLFIEDEGGRVLFDLFFSDVESNRGSPELEELTARTCRRHSALIDIFCAARATMLESRMLIARARRRPQLAYSRKAGPGLG